jgi:hypothetical protein
MVKISLEMVTIQLSPSEAEAFKLFQRYHGNIKFMQEQGVFDVKGGAVTLNFDSGGVVQSIDIHRKYQRSLTRN